MPDDPAAAPARHARSHLALPIHFVDGFDPDIAFSFDRRPNLQLVCGLGDFKAVLPLLHQQGVLFSNEWAPDDVLESKFRHVRPPSRLRPWRPSWLASTSSALADPPAEPKAPQ